jgi:uncharacterized membrane protein HdeD (DUF308 family)
MEIVMLQTEIHNAVRGTWWALVIRGLLSITIGILVFARPLESVAALALVIACWALVQGVVNIVHAFDLRGIVSQWWLQLLSGIVGLGFGIAALRYYPALSLSFAVVLVSWWLMLGGGLGIFVALQERRAALPWGWTMTWGILSVAAGIFAFASPPVTLAALMGLISGVAIVSGVALLVGAYQLRQVENDVTGAIHAASTT